MRHPLDSNLPTLKSPLKSRGFFVESLRFLVLFLFFFTLSLTVVMFPTLVARVNYLLGLEPRSKLIASLPIVGEKSPSQLEGLLLAERNIPQDSRLIIPQINVDVPVVYSQNADNASLMEELKRGVIHYPGTAYPGEVGNVFITGHSSYYWWSGGQYNQVFANLDKLKNGDLIYLYQEGQEYLYQVFDRLVVKPNQVSILAPTAFPQLTLMTCTPLGTNLRRLVVKAQLITPASLSSTRGQFERLPEILPL